MTYEIELDKQNLMYSTFSPVFSSFATALPRRTNSKDLFPLHALKKVMLTMWVELDHLNTLQKWKFNMILFQALTIDSSSSVWVKGLTIQNSQQMHFTISRSQSVRIIDVQVSAPEDSPNTDGIHITDSTNVLLQNCKIGTGSHSILPIYFIHLYLL